jgi:hypothetical protein
MNIYTGLLFQQGYIHDPKLARSLAGVEASEPSRAGGDVTPPRRSKPDKPKAIKPFRRGSIASVCSVALSPFR